MKFVEWPIVSFSGFSLTRLTACRLFLRRRLRWSGARFVGRPLSGVPSPVSRNPRKRVSEILSTRSDDGRYHQIRRSEKYERGD